MNLKELQKPLSIQDIDFRIQSINAWGKATILAYKDARVDMNRLDDVVGAEHWKREHFDNNTRCKVSVWNDTIKEWISKEDVGTASMTEKEKGLASDSFKRACFNWGIGRELYDYPVIKIQLNKSTDTSKPKNGEWYSESSRAKQGFGLKLKEWRWKSEFTEGELTYLGAIDTNKKVRFTFGELKKK